MGQRFLGELRQNNSTDRKPRDKKKTQIIGKLKDLVDICRSELRLGFAL